MSRKSESGRDVSSSKDEGTAGYCQVCGAYCTDLGDHAQSCQHGPYQPIQYPQLESIFDYCDLDSMGCLRKSLKIVKSPPSEIFEKPSLELPVVTMNGHVPRSNIEKAALYNGFFSSERRDYDKSDNSPDEDEDDVFSKEDSSDDVEISRKRRSRQSKKTNLARRGRISRKRLSVEEKLIEDNKSYYKVEVLNSKLRSTEYFINQKQLKSRVGSDGMLNGSCSDEMETAREEPSLEGSEPKKEPVVVRFKKVRKSQLSVLSDEAESFMFGDSARRETRKESSSPLESSDSRDSEESSSGDEELPKIHKMVTDSDDGSHHNKGDDSDSSSPPVLTCERDSASESELETEECSLNDISLDSITFTFENPPKSEPWIETHNRQEEGKNQFYYPYYHEYPKVLLPYEYPATERLKLLSGKKGSCFGRRKGRRFFDDGKPRKSPRCHASTLAVMSNFLRRPLRECTKTNDFSYEEESRSSLPDTVETSSSTSEFRGSTSFINEMNLLPVDASGDVFAAALARVARGETSTLQIDPGPCMDVNPKILDSNYLDMNISLQPGLMVPLEEIVNQNSCDTSWMNMMDYSCDTEQETVPDYYKNPKHEIDEKTYTKCDPYCWPELPLRKRRKKMKKQEETNSIIVPPDVKCDPCEIKLEQMSAKILEKFSVKGESFLIKENSVLIKEEPQSDYGEELPAVKETSAVKRGRGRPRKKTLSTNYGSSSELSSMSQPPPAKTYLKKNSIPGFSLIQRSFINQIV